MMISSNSQTIKLGATVASAALLLACLVSLQGCAGDPEFDKAADHTPESLVQEFLIRYKRLPDQASAKQKAKAAKIEKIKSSLPDPDAASGKSARKEAESKKQMIEKTETLDNLIDTLEVRLGRLKGMTRPEAARKVMDLIEKESTIRKDDRQAVIDRLTKISS